MNNFPASLSNITQGVVNAYVEATADCEIEAILRSADQYGGGRVDEHKGPYAPPAPDFARNARMWVQALRVLRGAAEEQVKLVAYPIGGEPPPPLVPLGPIEIDHGFGKIDMREMSHADKEAVIAGKKLTGPGESARPALRRMGE